MLIIAVLTTFLVGVLLGNYATTLFFRLPRNLTVRGYNTPFGKPPHCSVCFHKLKYYEYLPILSWIYARRCNYCGIKISLKYLAIEVSTAGMAVLLYLKCGEFSEHYVLLVVISALFILVLMLAYDVDLEQHWNVFCKLLLAISVVGLVHRVLVSDTLGPFVVSMSIACFLYLYSTATYAKYPVARSNEILMLLLVSGSCLEPASLLSYIALSYALEYMTSTSKTTSFRICLMVIFFILLIQS
ncbi:prepilin peptidase [Rickettsiales endosymbiont of Peranema trichophorum]|nr:prepilin peptidase [Rickettsiales endosymbiont of Peranema trichophorum]